MSKQIKKYRSKIALLEQKIEDLDLSKNLSLSKLSKRNIYLSKIGDYKSKIQNVSYGKPPNGYGHDITIKIHENFN